MPAYRDACIHGLFHFDEATGVFVNRGLLGGTLTPVGAGHALSAASKFGANCYQAPASGAAGYISTATTFLRGMSPFMLSAWLYLTAYPGATVRRIIGVGQPSVPKPALEMNPDGSLRLLQTDSNNAAFVLTGVTPVPLNQWVHVEAHLDSALISRVLVNGAVDATTSTQVFTIASRAGNIDIGCSSGTPTATLHNCRIDEVMVMLNLTDHEGAFTPETAAYVNPDPIGAIGLTRPASLQAFPPTWPARIVGLTPPPPVYRAFWGGLGRIVGTTKIKGTPNTPVSRRVRLIREVDAACVGERWSDPVTGAYAFNGFDPLQLYTVIVYDGPRVFRAAVQDAVVPEVYTP